MAEKKFTLRRLLIENSEVRYKAEYRLPTGEMVIATGNKTALRFYSNDKVTYKAALFIFRPKQAEHYIYIDDTNPNEVAYIEAIKKDPEIRTRRNVSDGCRFELIDETEEQLLGLIEIKKRASVCNIVLSMPIKQLQETCYFFNYDIVGKTKEAILIMLLNPTAGLLWFDVQQGERVIDPKDIITQNSYGDDYLVKATVNKAIMKNIISVGGSGAYTFGDNQTILGANIDNVYAYFKANKVMFDSSLLPAVQSTDIDNEDVDYSASLEEVKKAVNEKIAEETETDILMKKVWNQTDRDMAEKEAEGFGMVGNIKGFKEETLRSKILAARQGGR